MSQTISPTRRAKALLSVCGIESPRRSLTDLARATAARCDELKSQGVIWTEPQTIEEEAAAHNFVGEAWRIVGGYGTEALIKLVAECPELWHRGEHGTVPSDVADHCKMVIEDLAYELVDAYHTRDWQSRAAGALAVVAR